MKNNITYISCGNAWSGYLQNIQITYHIRDVVIRQIHDVGFRIVKLTKT